jgi:chemotaxis protein methyltransferase CheR
MLELDRGKVERLRAVVAERLGLAYDGDRLEQLTDAVRERIALSSAGAFDPYFERLCSPASRDDELALLAERLTVTETYFFRHAEQIRAFIDLVARDPAKSAGRRLRVLSAGCASGEEPYSLAMALLEAVPDVERWDIKIRALDVNRAVLSRAANGAYSAWSLRATPDLLKARYFRPVGRDFVLEPEVRRLVEFDERNLARREPLYLRRASFDAVFCRNVLMYFTPATMRRVVAELREALLPHGYLFLGHAETLRGLSHGFHLCHTHSTFYYQRRDHGEPARAELPRESTAPAFEVLPGATEASASWFETIGRASERIRVLSARGGTKAPDPRRPGVAEPAAGGGAGLAPVLELVRHERFAEALELLGALPETAESDPDALIVRAVLLTNHGQIAEAERVCARLLAEDELNAGAHYVTALCREHAADSSRALEHDRLAMHLDASFAMPRLHAGLISKRAGELDLARRLLAEALDLLEREDSSRLLLFGGGFSRQALARLCQVELALLGGDP